MNVRALSHDLKEAVKWIKPGRPKGTVLPVLSNVLLEAGNHGVRMSLTDLELTVSALAGAKVSKAGATTVPFKEFERVIRSLSDGEIVRLKSERKTHTDTDYHGKERKRVSETCLLTCGSTEVTFKAIVADEFPRFKTVRGVTFKDVAGLPEACYLIRHAIANDHSRIGLTYAELLKGELAAADGFRLATVALPNIHDKRPIYVHKELAEFLSRQKEEPTKMVVGFKQKQMIIWFGDNFAYAPMYDGRYPDWKQIIPKSHTWEIRVPYKPFKKAAKLLKRLAPAAKILRFEHNRGRLTLLASEAETFEATHQIEAEVSEKPKEPFALNVQYLLDDLKARHRALGKDDYVVIQGNSSGAPVTITDFHSGLYGLIMPMHLSK